MRPTNPSRRALAVATGLLVVMVLGLGAAPASAQSPTFTMDPTSGPAGTTVDFASVTSCSGGEDEVRLSNMANPVNEGDFIATGATTRAGAWSLSYAIPGGTPVGPLTFYAWCSYSGTILGAVEQFDLSMAYDPQVFTVTSTTSSSTDTTAPPTTAVVDMWLDLDQQTYTQGEQMAMATGGWMPGTDVNITIFSDPVDLGFAVADSLGELSHNWTIPADFETGVHTVTLTGLDLAGNLVSLSSQFDVTPLAGALSGLNSSTTSTTAAVLVATTLPATGVTQYTGPLTVAGLLLALGGAGLLALERQRRQANRHA